MTRVFILLFFFRSLCLADTISWSAPENTPAGSSPAITGYEVWERVSGVWETDQTLGVVLAATVTPEAGNPTGMFAVRALWSGGRSALSDPVETAGWMQNLPAPSVGNTITPAMSRAAVQAILDAADPGDTLYLDGGTYTSNGLDTMWFLGGSTGTVHGTAGNLITVMPIPGEAVVLEGPGWADDNVGGAPFENVLEITGDYWRLYGCEIRDSGGPGISIWGGHCEVIENNVHDNWGTAINLGDSRGLKSTQDIYGTILRYNKATYSRQASGITFSPYKAGNSTNPGKYAVVDWVLDRNIVGWNGYDSDGVMNIFGGGNSDGIVQRKHVNDDYTLGLIKYADHPRSSRVEHLTMRQNLAFRNGDDGFDYSPGEGSYLSGNISWENFPSGNKGFKNFINHFGSQTFIGNVALGSSSNLTADNVVYFYNGIVQIYPGNHITGATSGATADVTEVKKWNNGTVGGTWGSNANGVLVLANVSGAFSANESISVAGVPSASIRIPKMNAGYEARNRPFSIFYSNGNRATPPPASTGTPSVVTGGTSGATGTLDTGSAVVMVYSGAWASGTAQGAMVFKSQTGSFIDGEQILYGGVAVGNVTSVAGDIGYAQGKNLGAHWSILHVAGSGLTLVAKAGNEIKNSLSAYNSGADDIAPTSVTNHLNTAGSPGIHDPAYDVPDKAFTGATIEAQWRRIHRGIMNKIMAVPGGNLHNAGTLDTRYDRPTAADHATTPSDPIDLTRMAWYGTAPDIGASQFMEMWPPVVSVGVGSAPVSTAPVWTVSPVISGSAEENQVLTGSTGSATGTPAPAYTYQWIRCNAAGASPADIAGQTADTYTLVTADIGNTIRVRVTATNTEGSASATSAPTDVITAYTPPAPSGGTATAGSVSAAVLNVGP